MRNTEKGFTLVELIVVITILAILGTIAFISLQGYSQDARNSKVVSDVRSLASAVETKVTEWVSIHSFVTPVTDNETAAGTYASGATLSANARDEAGNINYIALEQNSSDFGTDTYKIGTLTNTNTANGNSDVFYQIVGAAGPIDWFTAEIKGNYIFVPWLAGERQGLVSSVGSSTGLVQGASIANNATNNGPNL